MISIEQLRAVPNDSLRHFIEAWLQWRAAAILPHRTQVDLNQIKTLLPFISLLEYRSADDVRYRVAGTKITHYLGVEPTGQNYADLTPVGQWPVRRFRLASMVRQPCGGALHHEEEHDLRRVATASLTLPLLPDAPGGFPLLLALLAPLDRLPDAQATSLSHKMRLPERFTFVDIGAGVPASTEPLAS